MTGSEVLQRSLQLLGYSEGNGNSHISQVVRNRALAVVNLVYAELSRNCGKDNKPINSLSDEIELSDRVLNEIMPCGIAMYLANAEGDANNEAFWGREYNNKRATLTRVEQIKDVIPNVWG